MRDLWMPNAAVCHVAPYSHNHKNDRTLLTCSPEGQGRHSRRDGAVGDCTRRLDTRTWPMTTTTTTRLTSRDAPSLLAARMVANRNSRRRQSFSTLTRSQEVHCGGITQVGGDQRPQNTATTTNNTHEARIVSIPPAIWVWVTGETINSKQQQASLPGANCG